MSERTIGIYPQTRYKFRFNESYRAEWNFLPRQRAKVIAEQLTYLGFHEWLMRNLRHSEEREPAAADWSSFGLTVAEGFYKTDVLLYASVCEAALYAVLKSVYSRDRDGADQAVKDCFCKIEDRFQCISDHKIFMPAGNVTGRLCLRFKREVSLSDWEVKFASLIKAGAAIGIYDSDLAARLDRLRDDRNTIHLAKQIERNNQLIAFQALDRMRAKSTTEKLRVALQAFVTSSSRNAVNFSSVRTTKR
jgi:hypothetical protein